MKKTKGKSSRKTRRNDKSLESYVSPRCLNLDISTSSLGAKSSDDVKNNVSQRRSLISSISRLEKARPKLISLNNLKKIINEIYASKSEYDQT